MTAEVVIETRHLSTGYPQNPEILVDLSLTIRQGEFTAIIGENGSGKTTLIRTILGLHKADAGEVILFGTPVGQFHDHHRIGYLPQTPNMLPNFPANVREIVGTGLLSSKRMPRRLNRDDFRRIDAILDRLEITELRERFISELSGGQRRKVLLARALVSDPEILVMDEPTTELDPASRDSFYEMVRVLNRERGVTILLVSHDSATVGKFATSLLVIDRSLLFHGSPHEFCHSEAMCARFGQFTQHIICHQHDAANVHVAECAGCREGAK